MPPEEGFFAPVWLSICGDDYIIGDFSLPVYYRYSSNGQLINMVKYDDLPSFQEQQNKSRLAFIDYVNSLDTTIDISIAFGSYTHQRVKSWANSVVISGYQSCRFTNQSDTLDAVLPYITIINNDRQVQSSIIIDSLFNPIINKIDHRIDAFNFTICDELMYFAISDPLKSYQISSVNFTRKESLLFTNKYSFSEIVTSKIFLPGKNFVITQTLQCLPFSDNLFSDGKCIFNSEEVLGCLNNEKEFIYDFIDSDSAGVELIIRDRSSRISRFYRQRFNRQFELIESSELSKDGCTLVGLVKQSDVVYMLMKDEEGNYSIHSVSL